MRKTGAIDWSDVATVLSEKEFLRLVVVEDLVTPESVSRRDGINARVDHSIVRRGG